MSIRDNELKYSSMRWACFAGFRLDLKTHEFYRGERRINLAEQAVRILKFLLQHHGELVTREAIRETIWPDSYVDFETSLNTAIRSIRRALDDDPARPEYIETVPRRGYRFIPKPEFRSERQSTGPRLFTWRNAAGFSLMVGLAVFAFFQFGPRTGDDKTDTRLAQIRSPGYANFIRGQHALEQNDLITAELALRASITADPALAPAYPALARVTIYTRKEGWENILEAQRLVDKALQLDSTLAAAHALNARLALYYWRDPAAAIKAAKDAQRLVPGDPDSYAVMAYLHMVEGKPGDALRAIARAHTISPLSADLNADYGWIHYKARNWSDAEKLCKTSVEINPASQFALECVIHVNHSQGDQAEAAEYGLQLMALRGAGELEISRIRATPDAETREKAFWNWTLDWLEKNHDSITAPYSKRGIALTMLGRTDEAIAVLREAFDKNAEPFLVFAAVDPRLDELRAHAGFQEITVRSRSKVERK